MAYFAWMANFSRRLLPNVAWVMCGHVAHVANGTIHTANGCANPEVQGIGPHTTPGQAGEPRLYTEDEQWFDYWGQPNIARDPRNVAFGMAGFVATGGSMHNFYMWHGGNQFGNWSQSAPPWEEPAPANGPVSNTNTVRYANSAVLHSDGTRNEPLWSHIQALHEVLQEAAPLMLTTGATKSALRCDTSSPKPCRSAVHFRVAYGHSPSTVYSFALNTDKDGTVIVRVCEGGARPAVIPALTVLLYRESPTGCDCLFNSSAPPAAAHSSPIVPAGVVYDWHTWRAGEVLWLQARFQRPALQEAAILLDLEGLGAGRVWVNGHHVANYNLAIANCSVPRM